MYDHYIALDWSQRNMAIARMTSKSNEIKAIDVPTNLGNLKDYLKGLRGKKSLCFEETTTAHWLFTELKAYATDITICDPYRNHLLSEGAKNDIIDAKKLVQLLRANLLKPVFHGADYFISLRRTVSAYNDLIQRGVRLKNQRSALLRALGKEKNHDVASGEESFIYNHLSSAISSYEEDRKSYVQKFEQERKKHKLIKYLSEITGLGTIGAVKIYALVVDTKRFDHRNNYLSYCGLVRLDRVSGGRSYGSKTPRHRRELKSVFKTAALSAVSHENDFKKYYEYLLEKKRYPEFKARHAVARKIAVAAFGVLNSRKKYKPEKIGALKALSN
jgi:transposase